MDIPIEMLRPHRSVILSNLDNAEDLPKEKYSNIETTLTKVKDNVVKKYVLKRRPNIVRFPGREPKKEAEMITEPVVENSIESIVEEEIAVPETTVTEELSEVTEPIEPDHITLDENLLKSLLYPNIDLTLINDINTTLETNIEESMFDIPSLFGKEEFMKLNSKDITPATNFIGRCKLPDIMEDTEADLIRAKEFGMMASQIRASNDTGYKVYFINNTRDHYYWKDSVGIIRHLKPLVAQYTRPEHVEHEGLYAVMESYGLDHQQKAELIEAGDVYHKDEYWQKKPFTPGLNDLLENYYVRVYRLKTDAVKSRPFGMYVPDANATIYDTKEKATAKDAINDMSELVGLRDIYAEILKNYNNTGVIFTYRLVHNEDIPISRWVSHNGAVRLMESVKSHIGYNGKPAPDGLYITSITMNGLSPEVTVIPASEKEAYERYVFKSKVDAFRAGDFETRMREIKSTYELALDKEKDKLCSQTREAKKRATDFQNKIDEINSVRDNIAVDVKNRESLLELQKKIHTMDVERVAEVNEVRNKLNENIRLLGIEHAGAISALEKQHKEDLKHTEKQQEANIRDLQKTHKEELRYVEEKNQKELDRLQTIHDAEMLRTRESFMAEIHKANSEAERARNDLAAERKQKHTETGYLHKERQWGFETFGKAAAIICGIAGGLFALFKMAPVAMAGVVASAIKMKAFI